MSEPSRAAGPEPPTAWRDALRAAGGLAAIALAGCTGEGYGPGAGQPELGQPEEDPLDAGGDSDVRQRHRAGEFLLEQIRDGLPGGVLQGAEAVGEAARESVVYLELYEGGFPTGQATGWFVDDGVIATNAHNLGYGATATDEIRGYTQDGARFQTTVAGHVEDAHPDVAVLSTDFTDAPSLPVRRDADLEEGDPLVQVGHPGGFGNWVICVGRFAGRSLPLPATGVEEVEYTTLTTSVPGVRGVSGSPVLDLEGEVVGMTTSTTNLDYRDFGDPVRVAPDRVFDTPIGPIGTGNHVAVDVVGELVERWT